MTEDKAKKVCFVVGPIGLEGSETRTHSDWLYEMIIKPAVATAPDFSEAIRADKIATPGMITTQVIEYLLDADLVIADLSLANPNAFYEIGIRHMAQKPIVHMQLKGEVEPFDTRGFRAIKFALKHPSDISEAVYDLTAAVKLAADGGHRVENPVTHARGRIQIEQTASPEQRVILDEMRSINDRLARLEHKPTRSSSGVSKLVIVLREDGLKSEVLPKATDIMNGRGLPIVGVGEDSDGDLMISFEGRLTKKMSDELEAEIETVSSVKYAIVSV